MKRILQVFIKSIIAGIIIGIGGCAYTAMYSEHKIVGAILFSIALTLICSYKYLLYTGKVCYIFTFSKNDFLDLFITLIGNILGTTLIAIIFRNIFNIDQNIIQVLIDSKLNTPWYELILKGIMCGILICFAVNTFNANRKYAEWILTLCVIVFILCGFEHSIADSFYLQLDNGISIHSVLTIVYIVIGNSIGGIIIPGLTILTEKLNNKSSRKEENKNE